MKTRAEKSENRSRTLDSNPRASHQGLLQRIENLSGVGMGDVKMHFNSDKPAQLNAHAYAAGTDIHIAPGQERHLPHEAWHVVQQKQGRVRPTKQMRGVAINDNKALETEATVMGNKALSADHKGGEVRQTAQLQPVVQLVWKEMSNDELYTDVIKEDVMDEINELINRLAFVLELSGTIISSEGARIDMQGKVRRGDEKWANIQIQLNIPRCGKHKNTTIAGVICPFDLDIAEIRNGLRLALGNGSAGQRDMMEWERPKEEDKKDTKKTQSWSKKNKKGPKKSSAPKEEDKKDTKKTQSWSKKKKKKN